MIILQTQKRHLTRSNTHPYKNSQQTRNRGKLFPLDKEYLFLKHLQLTLIGCFPTKIRQKTRIFPLTALNHSCTGHLGQYSKTKQRREREIKDIQIGKEERKPSLSVGNMIAYFENSTTTTKVLDLRSNYSKVVNNKQTTVKWQKI